MISFFIPGFPKPAGSKRGFAIKRGGVFTGKVAVIDACKTSRDWKSTVSAEARAHVGAFHKLLDAPLKVSLTFQVLRPKGHFRTGKNATMLRDSAPCFPAQRPDVLKLARAVEDALTGIIWRDDSQIVTERIAKRYADNPGCIVEISEEAAP